MNWREKIIIGMKLIREGCEEAEDYSYCQNCPFKLCHNNPMQNREVPDSWTDSDLQYLP